MTKNGKRGAHLKEMPKDTSTSRHLRHRFMHLCSHRVAALSTIVVACLLSSWLDGHLSMVPLAKDDVHNIVSLSGQEAEWRDKKMQILHGNMVSAEGKATGILRSVSASKSWLESAMLLDRHLVATGAPIEVRGYTLSEIQRIALHHFPWNALLANTDLLRTVASVLSIRMLMHDEVTTCCSSDSCLDDQVKTSMILLQLNMTDEARAHLRAAKAALIESGSSPSCRSMVWLPSRLTAPLDSHFPTGYDDLVDATQGPIFWSTSDLPLALHLQHHAEEILAELAPLCSADVSEAKGSSHFGPEKVVTDLALPGSWTSLPLLHNGAWNVSACDALAPRTCALLRRRPELQGAMRSASMLDTIIQQTFVSVYRLRKRSKIHRHVGSQWRLNTHLGLVTPPGAQIRVWNESREWEAGKAFAFLDAADHDVVHNGQTDRCVLNVVSWHPAVMERRSSDPSFAQNFVSEDGWPTLSPVSSQQ